MHFLDPRNVIYPDFPFLAYEGSHWIRRRQKGVSQEKFHAAPPKKQACFLEGALPARNKGKRTFLEAPLLLRRCCVELFMAYPLLLSPYWNCNSTPIHACGGHLCPSGPKWQKESEMSSRNLSKVEMSLQGLVTCQSTIDLN